MDGRGALALAALVVLVGLPAGAGAQTGSTELTRTASLSLTPGTPGEIGVTVRYDVPDPVTELRVGLPAEAEDVRAEGFERDGDAYEWTGATEPTVRFDLPVNRTETPQRGAAQSASSGLFFADVGPWAIAPVPSFSTRWSWRGEEVTLARETRVDGSGAVGDAMAYLGTGERYTRTANGQEIALVVPDAASLSTPPEEVLDALSAASALRIGGRDERVVMIAAPTGPEWGPSGLQYGENAAWVRDDATFSEPDNTWLHEYVHTRQAFETEPSARWLVEGSARYYAARLALEEEFVSFAAFRRTLENGERRRYADAVLADPASWGDRAQYAKGALVAGELDRRLRVASGGEATLDEVVARANARSEPLSAAAFLDAVAAGDASVREPARRYTRTDATPEAWDVAAHEAAFGLQAPRFSYEPAGETPFRVTGPHRNASYETLPTLAVGETLEATVRVENVGTEAGPYNATLRADGRTLDAARGSLEPGERENVTLAAALGAPADELRVGLTAVGSVRRPAAPSVGNVAAGERTPEGRVPLTYTVSAPDDLPAGGTLPVTLDGERVATERVALGPGESAERELALEIGPGEHTVEIGNATVELTVSEAATNPGASLGPAPAALALLSLSVLWRWRR
jgi:hypothetical protein